MRYGNTGEGKERMRTKYVTLYLNSSIKKPYHRVRYPARFFWKAEGGRGYARSTGKEQEVPKISPAPGMHLQMRVLAQSINVDIPPTASAAFELFALFGSTILSSLPDGLNHGDQIFS